MTDRFIPQLEQYASTLIIPLCVVPEKVKIYAERFTEHIRIFVCDQTNLCHGRIIGAQQKNYWALSFLLERYGRRFGELPIKLQVMEPVVILPRREVPPDKEWTREKSSQLGHLVSRMMECEKDYRGEVLASDHKETTTLTLKSANVTAEIATAISRIVKMVARNRGRHCEFRAEKL